jgi:cold shock CspA family protein
VTSIRTGRIKFFNRHAFWGFIQTDSGEGIFVHGTASRHPLKKGEAVEFAVESGRRGPIAKRVRAVTEKEIRQQIDREHSTSIEEVCSGDESERPELRSQSQLSAFRSKSETKSIAERI